MDERIRRVPPSISKPNTDQASQSLWLRDALLLADGSAFPNESKAVEVLQRAIQPELDGQRPEPINKESVVRRLIALLGQDS